MISGWPEPDYVNPATRGNGLVALSSTLIVVGCFIVLVRTYTRLKITRAFGLDDALIILAYVLSIGLSVLVIIGNRNYYSGRHIWDVPASTFVPHRRNIWFSELIYVNSSSLVKISVLLFYRRLSSNFSRKFLWAAWAGLIVNITYLLFFTSLLLGICRPLNAYWDRFSGVWLQKHPKFFCYSENIAMPLSAALSVVTDLYATIVPLVLVWIIPRLTKDKMGL